METRVTEIADGIHQLTTHIAEIDFGFNQYLVVGDEPLLFHTGMRQVFPIISGAVSQVVPAESLQVFTQDRQLVRELVEARCGVQQVGVLRGPSPPCHSLNRTWRTWVQNKRPVNRS